MRTQVEEVWMPRWVSARTAQNLVVSKKAVRDKKFQAPPNLSHKEESRESDISRRVSTASEYSSSSAPPARPPHRHQSSYDPVSSSKYDTSPNAS